jgi:hypothetical protein
MQTIPKHHSFKLPRWQKLYTELRRTLEDDIVRLEELKALIRSGHVCAMRAIKPGAIRVEASKMPSVDWTLHTPTVAGTTQVPPYYFERITSQPSTPVAADPNDPFAASAAFSTLSLSPGAPPAPPPVAAAPYPGAPPCSFFSSLDTCGVVCFLVALLLPCYLFCLRQVSLPTCLIHITCSRRCLGSQPFQGVGVL